MSVLHSEMANSAQFTNTMESWLLYDFPHQVLQFCAVMLKSKFHAKFCDRTLLEGLHTPAYQRVNWSQIKCKLQGLLCMFCAVFWIINLMCTITVLSVFWITMIIVVPVYVI